MHLIKVQVFSIDSSKNPALEEVYPHVFLFCFSEKKEKSKISILSFYSFCSYFHSSQALLFLKGFSNKKIIFSTEDCFVY